MNAQIDRDGCIGCGLCCEICPEVFRLADDNLASAYASINASSLFSAKEAEYSCPVAVIHVSEN